MILYNLFPLLAGHFSNWNNHINRAADMGFDWIFVNPVQKPGGSGSLYSIADYFQLNPRLVDTNSRLTSEEQLRDVIQAAENRGLKMMVDLVINHCAADSPLAKQHPEWFEHEADGSIAHPYCLEDGEKVVWRDLIRFDHWHPSDPEGLYNYFFKIVEYLREIGFKGFRCDAAYQIPAHLWKRLITDTKNRDSKTVFAAETLGCTPEQTRSTAQAGFDYLFNSSKWWDFESNWLLEQYQMTRDIAPSISFPESHDTDRLSQEARGDENALLKQRYLFAATFSAGVMIPIGFEAGFRRRLHVVKTKPEDWEQTDKNLHDFIARVNALKKRHPILCEESINTIVPYENRHILLLHKASTKTDQEALIVLNKDSCNWQHFQVPNLNELIRSRKPLVDVSPEYPTGHPPAPFRYDLNPGQGLVMVTESPRVP